MSRLEYLIEKGKEEASRELSAKFSISIPGGIAGRLDTYCDLLGFTRSALIAELLSQGLDELDEEAKHIKWEDA